MHLEYKLQWRSLSIHLELIAGSCRKINFIFFNTKKQHYLPAYSTVFPFPDVSGFMDMQFILIDLYSLIFLYTSVSILAALGEKREGGLSYSWHCHSVSAKAL